MAKHTTLVLALVGTGLFGWVVAGCSDIDSKLKSADPRDRREAVQKLSQRQDPEALAKLRKAAEDPDEKVAKAAVEGMSNVRAPAAREAIREVAAKDKRAAVLLAAVSAMARRPDKGDLDVARQIFRTADPQVLMETTILFVIHKSYEDIPMLVEAAEAEQDLQAQTRTVRAIEAILGMTFRYDPGAPAEERKKALERIRMQAAAVAAGQAAAARAKAQGKSR
jgi:HEAT repeat protein